MIILSCHCRFSLYIKINEVRRFSHKVKYLNDLLLTMPKDKNQTVELQKQRRKIKEKNMKYTPGSVTLQVLGSGAKGSPRSLYVFTDQSRYLFNCGEGTQRLAHEHKMKLSKLEHIFITHPCWENIGGLPGVALTIQDVGVPEITIHGPAGTADIFMATKRFVVLKDLNVKFRSPNSGTFEDSVMRVNYVPILPTEKNISQRRKIEVCDEEFMVDGEEDEEDYYAYEKNETTNKNPQMKRRKIPDISGQKRFRSLVKRGEAGSCSICYVCRLHSRHGTLLLDKCVEKGVPPGPLLGQLKSGRDVSLPNGNVVKAKDVCSPPDPGPVFIVIDCPSPEYIDAILLNEELNKYFETVESEDKEAAMAVVHFCSSEVLSNPKYLKWVGKFPASTAHLSFGEENSCSGSIAVHRLQYKLNLLHPRIFPLLADSGIPHISSRGKGNDEENGLCEVQNHSTEENSEVNAMSKTVIPNELQHPENQLLKARTFLNVHLRPRKGLDSSSALQMDCQEFIDETLAVEGFKEALQEFKKYLENNPTSEISFPKVLFLGTGSCIPNKTRNTSGILLEISEKSCMLLDCGEGTYGQLVRFYGKEEMEKILNRLQCVFVSHLHADHHIGLISLLKERLSIAQKNNSALNTLYLLAPRQIIFWLSFYHDHFESVLNQVKLVPCSEVVDHSIDPSLGEHPRAAADMKATLGVKDVFTAPVCHCPNAFGVAISHHTGWKITYSGDTIPCKELVKLGKDSDLLIHEATMEDELVEEARAKRHSTTAEAINVGHEMNARFTILTHFSQRYAKLPRLQGSIKDNVGIAFDNMQVTLNDLKILPIMYPALKLMFADHCEEMDQKAVRRKIKQEREGTNL